jgi:signal transduction histidine kinase
MGANISVGEVLVLHESLFGDGSGHVAWHADAGVVLLGVTAALFVVAGSVRLARWRLLGDPHSALVGSALIVMGGLGLPLIGVAGVAGALHHRELAEAVVRAMASFTTMALVHRALSATVAQRARPSRILPLLAVPILVAFAGLATLEASLTEPVPGGPQTARVLSAVMVLGWFSLAAAVRAGRPERAWSRRAAPLFCGLGVAEALYGLDLGGDLGTAASLLVCMTVAVLGVRSAHLDLAAALEQTEQAIGSLNRTLIDARDGATELSQWQASLVHDASNAVAGLQAALGVLDARQDGTDPSAARLCRAATDEVRHLDHLLHRSPAQPCRVFDVGALVHRVGESARAVGTDVAVHAESVLAEGRPDDLVAVLKNLLVNARRHAPGAAIELTIELVDGQVRLTCADDGPGLDEDVARHAFERGFRGPTSVGSGLGLHDARALMRAQNGDLVLDAGPGGARFVATLPAPTQATSRIPRQRSTSAPTPYAGLHVGMVR